ncbi:MAG: DUF6800 family protein [Pirellulaceae bacterium]|nr:DUF6800 family protein [Pirellulaceae bacterium]
MAGTERQRELRRRRTRAKKLVHLAAKSKKASKTEKSVIVHKLRRLTPGAEQLIAAWNIKV